MTPEWHFIAGEYPPQPGGVSDYTRSIAHGLSEKGHIVNVWAPKTSMVADVEVGGPTVHRSFGDFGVRGLRRLGNLLKNYAVPRRILVQYVPHAFGYKAMNLPFARWVWRRAIKHCDQVHLMVHEVAYPWVKSPMRHNLLAFANEWMMRQMLKGASTVFVSTLAWRERLIRLGAQDHKIVGLPIPSNIPENSKAEPSRILRRSFISDESTSVVGHFGTYGHNVLRFLNPIVERLFDRNFQGHLRFIGGGSDRYRDELSRRRPELEKRTSATGRISEEAVAENIQACDVMLQPYGDGANTRRTSLMACLINHRPVVATDGHHCEPFWHDEQVVLLAELGNADSAVSLILSTLNDPSTAKLQAARAYAYYQKHLSMERTIERLLVID